MNPLRNWRLALAVCGIVLGMSGALLGQNYGSGGESYYHPGWNLFSPQQDVQVGQQAEQQEMRKLSINHDAVANRYITALGGKLARHFPSNAPRFPFRFHVVNSKEINAFALPGGAVFINSGAVCAASNEAQLAGVMGHEMSHVELRHSTSEASKQQAASIPLGILGALMGNGMAGQLARAGTQFAAQAYFLHYSRGMESQADALGAQVMDKSGYNPVYMAQFFDKLKRQGGQGSIQFLSDHPDPGNREAAIEREIPTLGSHPPYVNDSREFHVVRQRLCGAAGSGPGAAAGQRLSGSQYASPSARVAGWQSVAFQNLQLAYPRGWSLRGQRTSELALTPGNGISNAGGQPTIVRGVIVSSYQPPHAANVDQATADLIAQLRQANPELRESYERHQSVTVDGVTGDAAILTNRNAENQPEVDRLVSFPRNDGSILYLIFIAPQTEFGGYEGVFNHMLYSLRVGG